MYNRDDEYSESEVNIKPNQKNSQRVKYKNCKSLQ